MVVDKVVETRVSLSLYELLGDIIGEHFDGVDGLYVFVDNRKVSLDASVALKQFEARDDDEG
jgi:hypothetical protein